MDKIYCIIVTYNALHKGWIDWCLDSLYKSTVPVSAIIVDNNSTDGTREYVPIHHPNVVWLPQDKNLGFGQANNVGIKYALNHGADFILLLNQDASIHKDAIKNMLDNGDKTSLMTPVQLNGKGDLIDYSFKKNTILKADNSLIDDLLIGKKQQPFYEVGEYAAACWFMPVDIIKKIGGFNPLFFHYGEDNNYYHRLVFHKIKSIIIPSAYMYHDRTIHGNNEIYNRNLLKRKILLTATNINLSLCQRIKGMMKILIDCYKKLLKKHSYIPGTFTICILRLLLNNNKISMSIKTEKEEGLSWL